MPERKNYNSCQDYLKAKQEEWEELCIRCGGCCGAYDDPCQYLRKDAAGAFCCSTYSDRFGTRKTLAGEAFDCVSIKKIINTHWKNDHLCVYKKYLKTPWILAEAV